MRWLTLYARSRQLPLVLGLLVALAILARLGGAAGPRRSALLLAAGAIALTAGLGSPDPALDRTAALRWPLHRAAHVLLGTVLTAALLPPGLLTLRDSAGLTGLAALGAACFGRPYAWLPPFTCLAAAFLLPPAPDLATRLLTWPLLPPGATPATLTALTLAVTGTTAYALAGPRR
ncbi:hypothetical protein GCM10009639_63850 [Kitasatospora putterlickiae]|uniref:Integral membrane protein n=1 Tax=Kitasatospora putterlickiae TaxID=221725 RepID=A0ABN1YGD1_9ACTN